MKHVTYCRICPAACGLVIDVEGGRATKVAGDTEHPLTRGFTCPKGRRIADFGADPGRLRSSRRRVGDTYEDITPDVAIAEIAARLQDVIDAHGADSVAFYSGTQASMTSLTLPFGNAWWRTIGSRKNFSSMTIDQSAKWVAESRLGRWAAGAARFADADVWMLVGTNPLVSMQGGVFTGFPIHDGLRRLQREKRRGLQLIVVDPRRTELATYADLHLQLIPGTDAVLFAGLLNLLLTEGMHDAEFCDRWVSDLDGLRHAVGPFSPEVTASICGVPAEDIVAAARLFGRARRGAVTSGTGPDMASWSNVAEHLIQTVNVVCGRFPRPGDALAGHAVLSSGKSIPAEVVPPDRTWETDFQSRFGYGLLQGQLPTPTLADEMLTPGPDRIRALVVSGGNPAAAVPDQDKMIRALQTLDLLVTVDPFPSETARLAHYVIAPVLHLERPDTTRNYEGLFDQPFAQYTPPLLDAPPGTIDDWVFFLRLAWARGSSLTAAGRTYEPGTPIPTTDEVLASFAARARVPLEEVKRHPHGAIFAELPAVAAGPARPEATARFDVMPDDVADELARAHTALAAAPAPEFPFRLVVRRSKEVMNSLGHRLPGLVRLPQNPCFVHPDDLEALGLSEGALAQIQSRNGHIVAVVHADASMRPGVVSMSHSFGGLPGDDDDPLLHGANVNRILSVDDDLQTISAMPLMSAVPVAISAAEHAVAAAAS